MSLTIPLRVQPLATSVAGTRLNLPRLRLLRRGPQQSDDDAILRAVAAAVALRDPKAALQAVHDLREEDADLAAFFGEITADLDPTLEAVVQLQRDPTQAGTPNDQERAFAEAVGADAALVSAAAGILKEADPDAAEPDAVNRMAALWVGMSDLKLLETAAGFGARRARLRSVLTAPTAATIADLQKKVKSNDDNLKELAARVKALEGKRGA